jgi:hypothetical protein
VSRAGWPDLPELLREIAEIAGIDAALAIADAKGGQDVIIPTRLRPDHWLVVAVGLEKAERISAHFTSGHRRQRVIVPLGPAGSFLAERRRRAKALADAQARGSSANQIAAEVGITERSVRRFRSKQRQDNGQGDLF